jgi:hypothetical protein
MSVVIDPQQLRGELARRGWSAGDLARDAGVSAPTVSAALAGRLLAAHTAPSIVNDLARPPGLLELDRLLPDVPPGPEDRVDVPTGRTVSGS